MALENGAVLLRIYSILDYGRLNVTTTMYKDMMMVSVFHYPSLYLSSLILAAGEREADCQGSRKYDGSRVGRNDRGLERVGNQTEARRVQGDQTGSLPLLQNPHGTLWSTTSYQHIIFQNSLWGKQAQINRTSEKTLVSSPEIAAKIIW